MPKKVQLQCKIQDIKAVPGGTIQLVSVKFNLGQREWYKAFRLNYDRPISMEEFKKELARVGVFPEEPEDFLAFVKQEADDPFTLEVDLSQEDDKKIDSGVGKPPVT